MGSHGIGIKRNDYHRPNRRENKSMHRHSHGRNIGNLEGVRLIKKADRPLSLTSQQIAELNEREEAAPIEVTEDDDYEVAAFFESLNSLDATRFLYLPPFLKADKVKELRFGENPSDRWWEWESELGLSSLEGRPKKRE